jgi:hypothetical protein
MVSLNHFMILFSATRSFLVYTDRPKNINDVENKVDEGSEKTSAKTTSSTMGWDPLRGSKSNGSSHFLKKSNDTEGLCNNVAHYFLCTNNIPAKQIRIRILLTFFLLNHQNVILDVSGNSWMENSKVTRKFQGCSNGQKGRLKHKFDSLGYYYTRNLSFHQNITQDLQDITGNFLVTVEISTTV